MGYYIMYSHLLEYTVIFELWLNLDRNNSILKFLEIHDNILYYLILLITFDITLIYSLILAFIIYSQNWKTVKFSMFYSRNTISRRLCENFIPY